MCCLARGGNVDVSGTLSARGTTGGLIEVLGDEVHLTPEPSSMPTAFTAAE